MLNLYFIYFWKGSNRYRFLFHPCDGLCEDLKPWKLILYEFIGAPRWIDIFYVQNSEKNQNGKLRQKVLHKDKPPAKGFWYFL